MLSAFVAIAVLGQTVAPTHVQEFWSQMAKLGFSSTPITPNDDGYRRLKIQGYDVDTFLVRSNDNALLSMNFRFVYQGDRTVSARYLQSWLGSRSDFQSLPVSAAAGLSGRISLWTSISLTEPRTPQTLKTMIDDYGYALSDLQREVPPAKDGKVTKLDEDQTVDCLDPGDVAFLVDYWGWTYRGSFGSSGPTIPVPAEVNGTMIVIDRPHPGYLIRDHLVLSARQAVAKNVDGAALVAGLKKKFPNIQVEIDAYGNLDCRKELDLSGGMKLSKLKSEIKDFANKVGPYVKPIGPQFGEPKSKTNG